MKIVRYADAYVTEKYELEMNEDFVKGLNARIREYNSDFVDITMKDVLDFYRGVENPREEDTIAINSWHNELLCDYVCDYISDCIWENYVGAGNSELCGDWEDYEVE